MSTNTTVTHQWIKFLPFAVILLAVALTLSLVVSNIQPTVRFGFSAPVNESSIQQGIEADAARYTAMAGAYLAQRDPALRSIEADTARYNAMAEAYFAQQAASLRWIEAYTARCNAMAEAYAAGK